MVEGDTGSSKGCSPYFFSQSSLPSLNISYIVSLVNMKFYELKRRKHSKDKENINIGCDSPAQGRSSPKVKTPSPSVKSKGSPPRSQASTPSPSGSPCSLLLDSSSDSDSGKENYVYIWRIMVITSRGVSNYLVIIKLQPYV